MLTAEMLRGLAPHARDDYVGALVNGTATFEKWGFTSPNRLAALLATIMHETGGLTIVRENTGWTRANLSIFSKVRAAKILPFVGNKVKEANAAYGDRMGNERDGTNDDDGWRFRGGGMIQVTGRDSYERAGRAIGVDLGAHPELIEDASVSLQAACWEMSQFLPQCDLGKRGWRAVCNGINRGSIASRFDPIGWGDRQDWYAKVCRVIGADGASDDSNLRIGDRGGTILAAQQRLAELGYAAGAADGIFGSRTRAAVLVFQAENNLTIDGKIGPETVAALNSDDVKPMPLGDRAIATADDLRKAGSETIAHSDAIKGVSGAGAAVSVTAGVAQSVTSAIDTSAPPPAAPVDLIATTRDVVTEVGSWKAITDSLGATFHWATSHWWVFAIVACFAFWKWGNSIELRRLLDHRSGANMGR